MRRIRWWIWNHGLMCRSARASGFYRFILGLRNRLIGGANVCRWMCTYWVAIEVVYLWLGCYNLREVMPTEELRIRVGLHIRYIIRT